MMKWELYKKLTLDQKMEWDFKFNKDFPHINHGLIFTFFAFMAVISTNSLIILKEYVSLKVDVSNFFVIGTRVAVIIMTLICLEWLIQVGFYTHTQFKEVKWLKESGIKK